MKTPEFLKAFESVLIFVLFLMLGVCVTNEGLVEYIVLKEISFIH